MNQFEILNQGIGLGAYAPGNEINTYPENSGFPLKAGGGLFLQLHYTTSGKETTDASEIALYLWDEEPERQVLGGSAADLDINIPPFAQRHEMVATTGSERLHHYARSCTTGAMTPISLWSIQTARVKKC